MTSPDERQMLGTGTVTHFVLDDDAPLPDPVRNGRTLRPRHHTGAAKALVFAGADTDVTGIVHALKRRGFPALIAPALASAAGLLTRWRPDVAIVDADAPGASKLLAQLERIEVPVLLVGDGRKLGSSANIKAAVLSPAEADEIASAVEIVIGRPLLQGMPELLDAGPIRIDIAERIAFVDDVPVELPPKEFALLAELALHPGQPIPSAEIATRVWPESAWITGDDVRRTVYRLRKLIGDDDRTTPLIRNRRGYGYVLEHQGASASASGA
jgi:DNA-binding response OmpR family regulator